MWRREWSAVPVIAGAAFVCSAFASARAQATTNEGWPELDLYWIDHSGRYRLFGMASVSRTADAPAHQGTLGLHADYVPTSGSTFWQSESFIRIGYRRIESLPLGTHNELRALAEATPVTRVGGLRLSDRARFEQRWIAGAPSQRYRDRIKVDHLYTPGRGWKLAPYGSVEAYYDTRYHALSVIEYRFGSEVARVAPLQVNLAYARHDTRFTPP